MEKAKFEAADGSVIEPTDFRLGITGKLEVPLEEMPDPKAEVTITLKGTAQSMGLKSAGRDGHRFWTLEAGVVARELVSIEIREPDPTLWDSVDAGDEGEEE